MEEAFANMTKFSIAFLIFSAGVAVNHLPAVTLDEYIQERHEHVSEGHISGWKLDFFRSLIQKNPTINLIGEIGFNAGHSTELFLISNPRCRVISFDIMKYAYSKIGKEYIDLTFPHRHQLIPGNSLCSVKSFSKKNSKVRLDLIFVDGNHSFRWAYNDIKNMRKLAHSKTLLVVDDINEPSVSKAWRTCVQKGIIKEIARRGEDTGLVLGRYRHVKRRAFCKTRDRDCEVQSVRK